MTPTERKLTAMTQHIVAAGVLAQELVLDPAMPHGPITTVAKGLIIASNGLVELRTTLQEPAPSRGGAS